MVIYGSRYENIRVEHELLLDHGGRSCERWEDAIEYAKRAVSLSAQDQPQDQPQDQALIQVDPQRVQQLTGATARQISALCAHGLL